MLFCIVFLILCVICYSKESKVTGLYKTFNVYGRFSAYITVAFMLAPIITIYSFIEALLRQENLDSELWFQLFAGIICGVIGFFLFNRIRAKCPEFLRKKLLISLLTTTFGVSLKILLFFISSTWELIGPKNAVLANGQNGFIYDGEVFTEDGTHVGTMSGEGEFTPNKNYLGDI